MNDDTQAIEAAKAESTLQLLFRTARMANDMALARLRATTGLAIRPAHTNLFPHIDFEGTRLTEIARRAGISKQAAAVLIDELVTMGGLERIPDPRDGRAKLVKFAPGSLLDGLKLLGEVEAELAQKLGQSDMASLHRILTALHGVLVDD